MCYPIFGPAALRGRDNTPFLQAAEARTNNAIFVHMWVDMTSIHWYCVFLLFQAQGDPISHPPLQLEEAMWLVHITEAMGCVVR